MLATKLSQMLTGKPAADINQVHAGPSWYMEDSLRDMPKRHRSLNITGMLLAVMWPPMTIQWLTHTPHTPPLTLNPGPHQLPLQARNKLRTD